MTHKPPAPSHSPTLRNINATIDDAESYRLLLDNVRDFAIFMLDPRGRIASWDDGAARIFGYRETDIVGQDFGVLFTEEDLRGDVPDKELRRALDAGRATEERWHRRADDTLFWASGSLTALYGREGEAAGTLRGFAKIARDMTRERESIERLRDSEERFRLLVEGVKEYAIFMLDDAGRIVTWNADAQSYRRYWGAEVEGRFIEVLYTAADIADGKPARDLAAARASGRTEERSWRARSDGERFWAEIIITALYDRTPGGTGEPQGFSLVMRDITDRKQAQEQVERLAAFPRFNPNPVVEFDANGTILFYNDATRTMLDRLERATPDDILPANVNGLVRGCVTSGESRRGLEITIAKRALSWSFFPVAEIEIVHGYAVDITERKRAEEQLMHDAFHDVLTGLPNRALFMDHLRLAIDRARRHPEHLFGVLFLDLDRFKIVNDSLGHMNGDGLLMEVARRLQSCLRPGDTVARLGGDEFTILLEDMEDPNEAIRVAERVQIEISRPVSVDGHEVTTTTSIGIALSSTGYKRPEDVLRDADTAMYRAKSSGKARHAVFDQEMHRRAMEQLRTESSLRRAIERSELRVHYQPIYKLDRERGDRLCGFEALARWHHPEDGLIQPDRFIPVAEETGLIVELGEWVLREACRQMRQWQNEFPAAGGFSVNVNLSERQVAHRSLVDTTRHILTDSRLAPGCLRLEITETAMMANNAAALEVFDQLERLGVELSVDDFGTGYSNLGYLHRFPVRQLKIDRCFVSNMHDRAEPDKNEAIIRTIVALARNLSIAVVAEGIENADQLERLRDMDCDYGQGFHLQRPLDAEQAGALLRAAAATTRAGTHAGD